MLPIDRYAVFAGEEHHAGGGASDLIGYAGSIEEAWLLVDERNKTDRLDWCNALDLTTGTPHKRSGWAATGHGAHRNRQIDWYDR